MSNYYCHCKHPAHGPNGCKKVLSDGTLYCAGCSCICGEISDQKRVIEEKKDLDEKLKRLINMDQTVFFNLPSDEQGRLLDQLEVMKRYSEILADRIAHFDPPTSAK